MSRSSRVKDRRPAPIQITAEQILRETRDRQTDDGGRVDKPRQSINDPEELAEYRMTKRKEFEDAIRRQRQHIGTWMVRARAQPRGACGAARLWCSGRSPRTRWWGGGGASARLPALRTSVCDCIRSHVLVPAHGVPVCLRACA